MTVIAFHDELTSVTETYKAFPDQQSVIVWIGGDAPSKLGNCAVRDALNWRCTKSDKKGGTVELAMANGLLSETVNGYPSPSLTLFYQAPALALVAGEDAGDVRLEKTGVRQSTIILRSRKWEKPRIGETFHVRPRLAHGCARCALGGFE